VIPGILGFREGSLQKGAEGVKPVPNRSADQKKIQIPKSEPLDELGPKQTAINRRRNKQDAFEREPSRNLLEREAIQTEREGVEAKLDIP